MVDDDVRNGRKKWSKVAETEKSQGGNEMNAEGFPSVGVK
jgi:hypothetical protein